MPATVDAALTRDLRALDLELRQVQHDIAMLRDPVSRRSLIDAVEFDGPDDEPDAFETMLLMEAMANALNGPTRRRGRGRA